MGAVGSGVETNQRCPVVQQTTVLTRGQVIAWTAPARKEPVAPSTPAQAEPGGERLAGRLGQLERDGPASLLLDHGGSKPDRVAEVDVRHTKTHEVAAPQLAVDRDIEHGQIASAALVLQPSPNGPDGLRGGFGPMIRPWFQDP